MTTLKDRHLGTVGAIRKEIGDLLEGMDYCLDWKPDPSVWCVREVVYHLLDTPPGGIHAVVQGILSGELKEYYLWGDQSNMTPERQANNMTQLVADLDTLFQSLEESLTTATDYDLSGKPVTAHLESRGVVEERNVDVLLERGFAGHWREHLNQIAEIRASLGFS